VEGQVTDQLQEEVAQVEEDEVKYPEMEINLPPQYSSLNNQKTIHEVFSSGPMMDSSES